jgi:adenosylhomocysteine nucleosidase
VDPNLPTKSIILVDKTIQYDVIQRFSKPSLKFQRGLETAMDLFWVDFGFSSSALHRGTIASADQDLDSKTRLILQKRGVLAADWESVSIATVCRLNEINCLILRGISDMPATQKQSENTQERDYRSNTLTIMANLLEVIDQIDLSQDI